MPIKAITLQKIEKMEQDAIQAQSSASNRF